MSARFAARQRAARPASAPARVRLLPGLPPIVDEVLRSEGNALDADTRALMDARFGLTFSWF